MVEGKVCFLVQTPDDMYDIERGMLIRRCFVSGHIYKLPANTAVC